MDEPHERSIVGAEESLIRFKHPDFGSDQGFYTIERYRRSGNQLHMARFLGVDAVAMLLIYKTSASYVVQERATEAYVAQLMDGEEIDWGETGSAASRLGTVRYRASRSAVPASARRWATPVMTAGAGATSWPATSVRRTAGRCRPNPPRI
jgi:hypothetical protein